MQKHLRVDFRASTENLKAPLSSGCLRCFYTRLILLPASQFSSSFQSNVSFPSASSSLLMTLVSLLILSSSQEPLQDCTELSNVSSQARYLWMKSWSWCMPYFRSIFVFSLQRAPGDFQAGFHSECRVPEKHWIFASEPVRSEGSSNLSRDFQTITECILTEAQKPGMRHSRQGMRKGRGLEDHTPKKGGSGWFWTPDGDLNSLFPSCFLCKLIHLWAVRNDIFF